MRSLNTVFAVSPRATGLALAVAASLAGSHAQAYWESFDGGGRVGDYLDLVSSANSSGSRIEIAGVCASACTMKLGARNVCVNADAQLWFHAARNPDGRVNQLGTLLMEQQYPSSIRAWASRSGALVSTQFTVMSGAQAIALGVPSCQRSEPVYQTRTETPFVSRPVASYGASGPACYALLSTGKSGRQASGPICEAEQKPTYVAESAPTTPSAEGGYPRLHRHWRRHAYRHAYRHWQTAQL